MKDLSANCASQTISILKQEVQLQDMTNKPTERAGQYTMESNDELHKQHNLDGERL